jgi:hypothetical protein
MKKTIDYEIHYDLSVEIIYLGEEEPNEHYFRLHRHFPELTFDDEEDEAKAVVFPDGKIEIESYEGGYLREEEVSAIGKMMEEILNKVTINSHE